SFIKNPGGHDRPSSSLPLMRIQRSILHGDGLCIPPKNPCTLCHPGWRKCPAGPALWGSREAEGDEQRTIELGQSRGGNLTPPSAEATRRQRPDLLAQGDGIHVEPPIRRVQQDLAGVESPFRPIGGTWDDQKHRTRRIDRIAADDYHWPGP